MQVFITGDVTGENDLVVVGAYRDDSIIPKSAHPNATLMRGVDPKYIIHGPPVGDKPMMLSKKWKESLASIITSEAAARVAAVFPASLQSTATLEMQSNMLNYGINQSSWPASEQQRMKEVRRGLIYIAAIRAAATALTNKGGNPCDDAMWPALIDELKL